MDADATGPNRLDPEVAYVHGACMVFLDAMGSGNCAKFKDYDGRIVMLEFITGMIVDYSFVCKYVEQFWYILI